MSFEFDAFDVVNIEIAKILAEFTGEFLEANRFDDGLGVAIHGGAVTDYHAPGAELKKTFASGGDDGWMRVHHTLGIEAYKVGLEQHGFVFYGKLKFAKAFENQREEILFVARGGANDYARGRPGEGWNELAIALIHRGELAARELEVGGHWRAGFAAMQAQASA